MVGKALLDRYEQPQLSGTLTDAVFSCICHPTDPCAVRRAADVPKPKSIKKEACDFFAPGIAEPNESEMLFFSLLLIMHATSVRSLDEWAKKVVAESSAAEAAGVRWRLDASRWPLQGRAYSTLFKPMDEAVDSIRELSSLETIAATMRSWDGTGGYDGALNGINLRSYVNRKYRAPSGNPKKNNDGPPRWRSWRIVHVASTILKHGVALRKALRLDGMAPEDVPTARGPSFNVTNCVQHLFFAILSVF